MTAAGDYNKKQLAAGKLTAEHVAMLVRFWQRERGLDDDGKAGQQTIASLDAEFGSDVPALPAERCWPIRRLTDGRQPHVTSHFRNPERVNHAGADIMYRYEAGDPATRVGDSGRTSKWWIPEGTAAIAVADGTIEHAGKTSTGWRVWVRHGDYATGYFHLTKIFVAPGDTVALGDPLGIIGDNPIDTDPDHLHFELVLGSLDNLAANRRDPMLLLKGAPMLEAV